MDPNSDYYDYNAKPVDDSCQYQDNDQSQCDGGTYYFFSDGCNDDDDDDDNFLYIDPSIVW